MQTGTKSYQATVSNTEIDDLSAMRLSAEPWRWRKAILGADLTAGAKVAAFAILEFINRKSGRSFASYATIAKSCEMTERGVRAAVAALREAGFVKVVRRGKRETNFIYLADPVTVTAAQGDRHGHDKVTVTTMTPNLRDEPLRDNLTDRPTSELLVRETAEVLAFEGKETNTDRPSDPDESPIGRVHNEHMAYCRITASAIRSLGLDPKLPDGRFIDRAIWEALPIEPRSLMVQKAIKGCLMPSEIAGAVRGLDLVRAYQRAA